MRSKLKVIEGKKKEAMDESQEMDRILAKINDSGMQSLSRKEKAFLERISTRPR